MTLPDSRPFGQNAKVGTCSVFCPHLSPPPAKQTEKTWTAWSKLSLPAGEEAKIQQILWHKLPVRSRLVNWLGPDDRCPLDGSPKTISHATRSCLFLPAAFDIIGKCHFPLVHQPVTPKDCPPLIFDSPTSLLDTAPHLSISLPEGLIAYSAVLSSWEVRMTWVRHPSFKKPDWETFLAIWLVRLRSWVSFANCSLPHPMAAVFTTAVHGMLAEGKLLHPSLGSTMHHTSQPPRKKRKLIKM